MDNNCEAHYRTNPRLKANIFSKLFLCWMLPYLRYGNTHELKTKDIFQLAPENQSEILGNKLEKSWKAEVEEAQRKQLRPNFLNVTIKTFSCNYLKYAIFSCASTFTPMLLPLVLKRLISHFDENSTSTMLEACSYVLMLMLSITGHALLEVNSKFSMLYIGGQVKTACSAIIYRKLLRLPVHAQSGSDGGKLITLLSNDVARFEEVFTFLHILFALPVVLILNGFLLWRIFGVTTVYTILIITTLNIPLQVFSTVLITKLREKAAQWTDHRLLLMDEIINGIRVIKMYTWEKPFENFTLLIRTKELNLIAKKLYFHIGLRDSSRYGLCISLYLTIAILISYEDKVTSLILFPLIHYNYDLNHQCGYFFSRCLTSLADTKATVKRIQDFLLLEEVTPFSKLGNSNINNNVVVNVKNVSVSWPECENHVILENISISIATDKLYALVGENGSGKSSLLKVILGELKPKFGQILNYGDISFANQEPWLFNGSIRSNILLGAPFNEEKYNQVIFSCALLKDFEQLPHGDKTVVGERGALLSGGQTVRINLARAIYRNAETYLLDDPLASTDYYVGKIILENCIKGLLKNKARILVTQKLEYIKECDEIILINNGRIEYQGNYEYFQNTDFCHYLSRNRELDMIPKDLHERSDNASSSFVIVKCEENEILETDESEELLNEYKNDLQFKPYAEPEENVEHIKQGKIPLSILKEFYSNQSLIIYTVIFLVITHSCIGSFDYLVSVWSQNQDKYIASLNSTVSNHLYPKSNFSDSQITLFYVIGGILVVMVISSVMELILFIKLHRFSCERHHKNMISSLLRAAVQFFDINDSGRILNRFSQDLGVLDEQVPIIIMEVVKIIITAFISILQVVIASPYMSIPVILSLFIVCRTTLFFGKSIRSTKRLEARAKALVLSHSNATFNGLITIRSSGAQRMAQKNFNVQQDNYMAAYFTNTDIFWSYSLWIEIVMSVFVAFTAFSFVFLESIGAGVTSAIVGYVMLQVHTINKRIKYSAEFATQFDLLMISTERTFEYTKLDQEKIMETKSLRNCASTWPSGGQMKFDHLYLKYSNSLEPVLKNINFVVEPGTKVGIIGQTGAGKSSLATALFSLAETEGSLFIDGIDTKTVSLKDLRNKISILPQKSILFSTSLRNNLDPLKLFEDAEIWSSLKRVKLDIFQSLDEELYHRSLSSGQRQLLCLARAILKKNKILILDEPTANIDARTDDLINSTIKKNFKNCTVLTIAHKLNSITNYDKILVIDGGQVIEYDEPRVLLKRKNSYFYKMWQALKHL